MDNVFFLTSNKVKAENFKSFGILSKAFDEDVPEVLSNDVETVVLYKAYDIAQNNIIVEDTSLEIEGASFYGTEIKHVYDEIADNDNFHDKKAIWKVSVCMKKNEHFYISTAELHGKLEYPALDFGYHFNKIFAVETEKGYKKFELLDKEEQNILGPRFKAVKNLVDAMKKNDFSNIKIIHKDNVKIWDGEYQVEKNALKNKAKI